MRQEYLAGLIQQAMKNQDHWIQIADSLEALISVDVCASSYRHAPTVDATTLPRVARLATAGRHLFTAALVGLPGYDVVAMDEVVLGIPRCNQHMPASLLLRRLEFADRYLHLWAQASQQPGEVSSKDLRACADRTLPTVHAPPEVFAETLKKIAKVQEQTLVIGSLVGEPLTTVRIPRIQHLRMHAIANSGDDQKPMYVQHVECGWCGMTSHDRWIFSHREGEISLLEGTEVKPTRPGRKGRSYKMTVVQVDQLQSVLGLGSSWR